MIGVAPGYLKSQHVQTFCHREEAVAESEIIVYTEFSERISSKLLP